MVARMSIRTRLVNLARAELNDLMDRVLEHNDPIADLAELLQQLAERINARISELLKELTPQLRDERSQRIAQAYANLELERGATWPQVKSAYRRLLRQYHPDRHIRDPEKMRVATELTVKLRQDYELLRDALKAQVQG